MENTRIPPLGTEKSIAKIEKFIERKVDESGSSGIVLGLSGGIDSTVVAYLSQRILGSSKVLGLIMPSETTSSEDVEHAQIVAEILGIEYEIIHIDPLIEPFQNLCSHESNELARANLKARIRMMILYYHSNSLNRLVVGTGNLSELLIGYFTKYGDGGVDILPIGDLYKTHVREVASGLEVPEEIIDKAPTAGLWPGQTDEEELGMKYEVLDEILYLMIDKSLEDNIIVEKVNLPINEIQRIKERVRISSHKINSPEIPPLRK
ncbi:MAG: NAD+ synthase [Methanobacteriaceae archaeon]|jgi:NAD+ synthase|nr:NAD+ synthase [Methanobacteriaceae archaeon]MDP2836496.1 NAD+ synthase [Methanobacteriaceae archaeon]MDP3035528.1 NAD+ synthase [Methanobacteriaceae archaeon]MDP3484567.1 NAD+ synthase [Methanobacteriaceae archaeon]MDP3622550.1 NAD+ synthase [Methanobacteriaceae archaeon]